MNGAGNDFIVIDNRFFHFSADELAGLARRYCRRRFGIGADGLLALAEPQDPGHDFRMIYFNADGSRATMCGNGARCLARYARLSGVGGERLTFGTDAGTYQAEVPQEEAAPVRLWMPPPQHFRPDMEVDGIRLHFIWTGTEHAVSFVDDLASAPVMDLGRPLRHHAAFQPAGANINFVQINERDNGSSSSISARTYEKGVEEETLACGTGALACAVVARLTGMVDRDTIDVRMPGGTLQVGFSLDGTEVRDLYLEGPAEVVYRGTITFP